MLFNAQAIAGQIFDTEKTRYAAISIPGSIKSMKEQIKDFVRKKNTFHIDYTEDRVFMEHTMRVFQYISAETVDKNRIKYIEEIMELRKKLGDPNVSSTFFSTILTYKEATPMDEAYAIMHFAMLQIIYMEKEQLGLEYIK